MECFLITWERFFTTKICQVAKSRAESVIWDEAQASVFCFIGITWGMFTACWYLGSIPKHQSDVDTESENSGEPQAKALDFSGRDGPLQISFTTLGHTELKPNLRKAHQHLKMNFRILSPVKSP